MKPKRVHPIHIARQGSTECGRFIVNHRTASYRQATCADCRRNVRETLKGYLALLGDEAPATLLYRQETGV